MNEIIEADAPQTIQAREALKPIAIDIATMSDTLEGIDVTTDDELSTVADLVKFCQGRRKVIEDKRKSLVDPLNKVVKDINALFKTPRDLIDAVIAKAKKKMDNYSAQKYALEQARKAAEQADAQREREEAEKLAQDLADISETAAPMAEAVVAQADKKVEQAAAPAKVEAVKSEQSTVVTNKTWAVEVLDVAKLARAVADGELPLHCIEPNMAALRDFSRESEQEREKFGCRFFLDIKTSVR